MSAVIEIEDISKSFGDTRALDGLSLSVPEGSVFGLLGPNGSGKTTLVRILATLSAADGGSARVGGHDVFSEAGAVRAQIGLTGQFTAIDGDLTGRENLEFIGRLSQLPSRQARARATELLERFGLGDAADRRASGYSGGMTRRLDLAASLVADPRILFLDEPTTGLDPASRHALWEVIRELVDGGTSILLTTQYLDEADRLAGHVAVIDHGRLIASGTPAELKDKIGGQVLEVVLRSAEDADRAVTVFRVLDGAAHSARGEDSSERVVMHVGDDAALVATALRQLQEAGVRVAGIELKRPSLDDVFFSLTGAAPAQSSDQDEKEERR